MDENIDDIYNMQKVAKKVGTPGGFSAPGRDEFDSSVSSGGVHVYGAAAEKHIEKNERKKRIENKKREKESNNRTKTDILGGFEIEASKNRTLSLSRGRGGKSRGRGNRRGRGPSSSNGIGRSMF